MVSEARKLQLIAELLKIDNDALLEKVEALIKGAYAPTEKVKLSEKYGGALKLTDKEYESLHQQLAEMRNEWE